MAYKTIGPFLLQSMQHEDNRWVGHQQVCCSPAAACNCQPSPSRDPLDLPYSTTEFKYAEILMEMLRPPPPGARGTTRAGCDGSLRG